MLLNGDVCKRNVKSVDGLDAKRRWQWQNAKQTSACAGCLDAKRRWKWQNAKMQNTKCSSARAVGARAMDAQLRTKRELENAKCKTFVAAWRHGRRLSSVSEDESWKKRMLRLRATCSKLKVVLHAQMMPAFWWW